MLGYAFQTSDAPIAFIDLEMSGLEPLRHEILSIGMVRVSQPDFSVLEEWSVFIKPQKWDDADPEAMKVNRLTLDHFANAVPLHDALQQFAEKTTDHIIAGWNCAYDWAFLEAGFAQTGVTTHIHKRILDVLPYAFAKLQHEREWNSMSLAGVAKSLDISVEGHHDALADARMTYEIYKKLVA